MMYRCTTLHHNNYITFSQPISPKRKKKRRNIQLAKDTDTIETEFLVDLVSSRCRVNAFSSLTYKQ